MKRSILFMLIAGLYCAGCSNNNGSNSGGGGGGSDSKGKGKAASGDTIKIGDFGSMTGKEADFGKSSHDGLVLAVEEMNKSGGVLGKQLEVVSGDDQSQNELAASVCQKLVNQDGVAAVIGEVASSRTMAGAPVCEQAKIPMISPSSTNPAVTVDKSGKVKEFVFRICFIDPTQGTVMAQFARKNLNVGSVGILVDSGQDYSKGLAKYFRQEFERSNGTVVGEEAYVGGAKDFRSQLTALKAKNPQAIFVPGYYTDGGIIAKQARELGLSVPLLGGDGWDSEELIKIGQDAIQGAYFSTHASMEDKKPVIQDYVKKYKAKYHKSPNALSALGYDAVRVLADAMKRAGTTDGVKVAKAIAETKGFDGVTGAITIDKYHNAVKPLVVLQVKGKDFKFVTSIDPAAKAGAKSDGKPADKKAEAKSKK